MKTTDSVLSLLDELCRVRGYRVDKGGPGERAIAELVAAKLREFPWLRVEVEHLGDEIYNVLAFDGDPSEIELLIVGHLDTVVPSPGWEHEEFSVADGRYYALGSVDTRGGIAAVIDSIGCVGPTRRVGYLFYGDEENQFVGMKRFVQDHPEIAPEFGVSVCGGHAEAYLGWRGCTEMEFLFTGVSGHASRAWNGANAAEAAAIVMEAVRTACVGFQGEMDTSANIASVHAGSLRLDGVSPYVLGENTQTQPPMDNIANKIPNVAWTLLDVRPGDPRVNVAFIEETARDALRSWNHGKPHAVTLDVHANFEMPAYIADSEKIAWLFETFRPVHGGRVSPPASTGFIDVTLVADKHGTQFVCLAPDGNNQHASDEYVVVASLLAYRDCMVDLLGRYAVEGNEK